MNFPVIKERHYWCCVNLCDAVPGKSVGEVSKHNKVKFHSFPKEKDAYNSWVKSLGHQNINLNYSMVKICSRHFNENDYAGKLKIYLKKSAIPKLEPIFIKDCLMTKPKWMTYYKSSPNLSKPTRDSTTSTSQVVNTFNDTKGSIPTVNLPSGPIALINTESEETKNGHEGLRVVSSRVSDYDHPSASGETRRSDSSEGPAIKRHQGKGGGLSVQRQSEQCLSMPGVFEPIILKKEELIKLEEPEISPENVHPCDRTPSKNDDFSSQLIKTNNDLISQDAVNPLADTSQVEKPIINTSYESHIPWPSWMSKSDQVYFSSIAVEDLQVILKKLYAERHHQILNISLQPIDFTKVIEEQLKNKIRPSTESKDNLEEEEVPCPKTEENHFIFVQNGVCNEEDLLNMSTEGCEQLRTNDWDIITKQELIEEDDK